MPYDGTLAALRRPVYELMIVEVLVEVACWARAWRKFFEARTCDRLRAETALAFVRELYRVERELRESFATDVWRDRSRAERLAEIIARRQAESRPVLAEFQGDCAILVDLA